jgi:hypothetical protein
MRKLHDVLQHKLHLFIKHELHEPRVHSDGSICERRRRRLQRLRHNSYDHCRVSQLVDLGSFGFRQP